MNPPPEKEIDYGIQVYTRMANLIHSLESKKPYQLIPRIRFSPENMIFYH